MINLFFISMKVLRQFSNLEVLKLDGVLGASYDMVKPCGKTLVVLNVAKTKFYVGEHLFLISTF